MDNITRIKLCGLRTEEEIRIANRLRPDFIGFVFAAKSKRAVTREQAEQLGAGLDPGIRKVGVFVREDIQRIAGLLEDGIIDIAQLHGGEDEEYIRRLRKLTAKPLIKAFRIDDKDDLPAAEQSGADHILLDNGAGGTGKVFDWELLKDFHRPYFLAGGLSPENVSEAILLLHPYAVDVSSGIETDGRKDPVKMEAFVTAARESRI